MENNDVYTPAQESYLDGEYENFYYAIGHRMFPEAQKIADRVRTQEFEKVAADMEQVLAQKKMYA